MMTTMRPTGGAAPRRRRWRIRVDDHATAYHARLEFADEIRTIACEQADFPAAELVFGELVHNAVRHAASEVVVELIVDAYARLRVADDGPCFILPDLRLTEPHAQSGRGLAIVRVLARRLRVKNDRSGQCVVEAVLPFDIVERSKRSKNGPRQ
jgi:signal transduction histidine kinase